MLRRISRDLFRAFWYSDLESKEDIQKALVWLNFRNSPEHRELICSVFKEFCQKYEADSLPDIFWSSNEDYYFRGEKSSSPSSLHHYVNLTKKYSLYLPKNTESQIIQTSIINKVHEYIKSKRGTAIWLTDLGRFSHQPTDPDTLISELGLYKATITNKDTPIICSIQAHELYKPTFVDAALAFYWYAHSSPDPYGYTLCLKTGRPTHKEWLIRKAIFEEKDNLISKVTPIQINKNEIHCSVSGSMSEEYWTRCKERIINERCKKGGGII